MSKRSEGHNDEGRVIAEFIDEEGSIIRVGIRRGIITKTHSPCRYVNKFATDKDIESMYIKTKYGFEIMIKHKSVAYRKLCGDFMEFEEFKKFIIYKYKLMGIEYKDNKLLCGDVEI